SFELNDAMTALSMSVTINGLDVTGTQTSNTDDNLTAAHIHALPPGAPLNASGGVVWGFFGTPFNNNNPGDPMNGLVPFASGVGGTFNVTWDAPEGNNTTLAAQLQSIFDGLAYINFHSVQFGGGEIRGQIFVAPEPASTGALLGLAVLGLFAVRKRTRLAPR
ncbi:MAG TPA: CHRD domain-containing protein, partial [Chthoniobacterales bacterium]|nr:CHRD domain-containing protein [Chthoniobacterales bacterium]